MKVALYYPWVYLYGGPERTMVELLSRSRHSWTIFTNRYEPECTFPALKQLDIVEMPGISVKRTFWHASLAACRIALQELPLKGYDVLVVFCEGLGDLVVLRNSHLPVACLCFTPLRLAFDPHYQQRYLDSVPHTFWRGPMLDVVTRVFRAVDRQLWKKYRAVFAISSEVRRRITNFDLCPGKDIELMYPGVDLNRLTPGTVYNTDFLVPGRIMWTKNLELAIDALLLLHTRRNDLKHFTLTLAGFVDIKSQPYLAKLKAKAQGNPQIRFIEFLTDEELFKLTSEAYALLYPPFNEDWGLVPLEGMALEKPVIAVNRGGPSESILDGITGFLVDPTPEAFAGAMEKLADNPALVRQMGRQARVRAADFDWTRFCDQLDTRVEHLAGSSPAIETSTGVLVR